ncbi:hypothetical protein DVH24_015706 [Malus domestica]|uniref:Reverse transcriptase zinc-binding domain-containing protein n=1 Tax=Malus domestica TaxID=3750 RepID=A0A498HLA8_MALDO|nr:hypothetical protein DVH24_015706 [Malus domestica]
MCKGDADCFNHLRLHCPLVYPLWTRLFTETILNWAICESCVELLCEKPKSFGGNKRGMMLDMCCSENILCCLDVENLEIMKVLRPNCCLSPCWCIMGKMKEENVDPLFVCWPVALICDTHYSRRQGLLGSAKEKRPKCYGAFVGWFYMDYLMERNRRILNDK